MESLLAETGHHHCVEERRFQNQVRFLDWKDQLSKYNQGQNTCRDGCESAILDVGRRRSVGPLLGVHSGLWPGGIATCKLRIPETHATFASADSWAWSVSQDLPPFLRRCFPSVAILQKGINIV